MTAAEWRRLVVAGVVVATLAAGGVGCGGSDDDDAAAGGSDEEAVTAVLDEMGARFGEEDYAGACELMTREARAQLSASAAQLGVTGGDSPVAGCDEVFAASAGQGKLFEDLDPEVTAVEVDGDRATVTADQSHDAKPAQAQLLREGGEWKVVTYFTTD
jgi:hypothetical protein